MRRYKLLSSMCRWRKHTGEKFGMGEVMTRFVNGCVRPVARGAWEVGGEEIMQKVCAAYFLSTSEMLIVLAGDECIAARTAGWLSQRPLRSECSFINSKDV